MNDSPRSSVGEFPEVSDEPTSEADIYAASEWVSTYQHTECPDCRSEAIGYTDPGGRKEIACRECRTGKRVLKRQARYGREWDEVRQWVLERDDHACQDCGAEVEGLHVHHRENLIWFETLTEAHRPANLEALCRDCHDFGPA